MAKINSSDISNELADVMGISKSAAKAYTDFIFDNILKHIENNDEVNIMKFGKFKLKITAPRTGRNICNKTNVTIPAKTKIAFEMSRSLAQVYNSDGPDVSDDLDDE